MSLLNVYADESCKDAHKYLALGALCVEDKDEPAALHALQQVREAHRQFGEVKWSENKRYKLQFFKDYVDVFFDFSLKDEMHFQALYVDTSTFKHRVFNNGDRDLGFNKLIFQLLLHRFGRRFGEHHPMHVYLDSRVTRHKPEDMRPMLNSELGKRWAITNAPLPPRSVPGFKEVRPRSTRRPACWVHRVYEEPAPSARGLRTAQDRAKGSHRATRSRQQQPIQAELRALQALLRLEVPVQRALSSRGLGRSHDFSPRPQP